ncbi:MAG: hypothetical protein ACLT4D_14215 [Blautia faecis]
MITRNGKITAEEARTIAEAAELFGSGEVTMTSRMTMEIQGYLLLILNLFVNILCRRVWKQGHWLQGSSGSIL